MRFQVPQFIETETKIVGPFTLKQFLYLASGAALIFILQYAVSFTFLIILGLPIAILALALAFYKIDGMPLPQYILMAFSFMSGTKKYVFSKKQDQQYIQNQNIKSLQDQNDNGS
ncbi:MAG: PrgI family protein [Candidatus Paceibacterota bacterium]